MKVNNFDNTVVGMSGKLKPYAVNLTKNIDEAKDLMQETIYRALVNKEKYAQGTNLKAWLFTIMRNIFINNYRRKVKQNTLIDTTDNLYYINSNKNATSNKAESNFTVADVLNAIENLSDDYKVPFMMYYRGFKYQEIADTLHLPLGTVKSRIFFARRMLKERLNVYNINK